MNLSINLTNPTRFLSFVLLLFLTTTCSKKENPERIPKGQLALNVGIKVDVFDVYRKLKAAEPDAFFVAIYTESGEEVLQFATASEIPESIDLPEGNYYVVAHSDNNLPAAFENDYYYGESDIFAINAGVTTNISLTCELANIRVTVVYAASVITDFDSYSTTVSNAEGSLTFDETETRAGFFDEGPLSIEATLGYTDGTGNLQIVTLSGSISNPETGKHYEVHIEASLAGGYGNIAIDANETYDTEIVTISDEEAPATLSGELLFTEIMFNPDGIPDSEGEYIEIQNVSGVIQNLNGLVLKRGDNDDRHVINADLSLANGGYALLAINAAAAPNVDYVYSGISLLNGGMELILSTYGTDGTDGEDICRVDYGAANFISGLAGASIQLTNGITSAIEAQDGNNWCASTNTYDGTNLGTPGTANASCPD